MKFLQFNIDDMPEGIHDELMRERCLFHLFENLPIVSEDNFNTTLLEKYNLEESRWLFFNFPENGWIVEYIDREYLYDYVLTNNNYRLENKIKHSGIVVADTIVELCEKMSSWSIKEFTKYKDKTKLDNLIMSSMAKYLNGIKFIKDLD